ncbi:ABC transporter permease [Bacillus sp. FJAT-49711]|uniref:ABC transporter permease n=1 Tax=Bacillus sp. FJAT-49711 TaxID=2833585 RepID=UPI001BC9798E|nr:ABC transporter permease [Bacillus sp. FJAT-49711]MBS4219586.1 ABC transporter permease [Bacillus sp. FJAT-49711]
MFKLMLLEWRKLKRLSVIGEVIIYWLILMFMPLFFIKMVMPDFGESYAAAIELNLFIQMGFILFGGSLINQVFIEEYKNKTISLSFGYPISRKKLFMAKVLFISLLVFLTTIISFIFTGLTTYMLDQVFSIINGNPTNSDIITYFTSSITRSLIITLISFIPLFLFGILKRLTVPTVTCSILAMQLPNFSSFLHLEPEFVITVMCILGALSVYLSIKTAESVGEI